MGLMSLFYMAGVLGFVGLIVSRLGLVDRMPQEKAQKLGIKETYREVSKSIAIKAGYMVTLVMRADIIVKSVFLFVWLVYMGNDILALTAVIAFENLSAGLGTAAYIGFIASLTDKRFTATQFALLTSFMGMPRVFAAAPTGYMVAAFGWSSFF